jgi:hypothetical protein
MAGSQPVRATITACSWRSRLAGADVPVDDADRGRGGVGGRVNTARTIAEC